MVRRDRQAGLTLVELMVTLVIAGLVTSSSFVAGVMSMSPVTRSEKFSRVSSARLAC